MSQRQVAKQLEKDQQEKWETVLFKGSSLAKRYRLIKRGGSPGPAIRDSRGRFCSAASRARTPVTEKPNKPASARRTFTMAMAFATIAISQLSRIPEDDPKLPHLYQLLARALDPGPCSCLCPWCRPWPRLRPAPPSSPRPTGIRPAKGKPRDRDSSPPCL